MWHNFIWSPLCPFSSQINSRNIFDLTACYFFFSVERILSPYANDRGKLSSTTLTAADVPWPEVIEACIKTLLSWLHTLTDVKNVYYLPQDLDEFKQPLLWTEATTETVKLIKRKSEVRLVTVNNTLSMFVEGQTLFDLEKFDNF